MCESEGQSKYKKSGANLEGKTCSDLSKLVRAEKVKGASHAPAFLQHLDLTQSPAQVYPSLLPPHLSASCEISTAGNAVSWHLLESLKAAESARLFLGKSGCLCQLIR